MVRSPSASPTFRAASRLMSALAFLLATVPAAAAQDLTIVGARVLDGVGAAVLDDATVVVRDGRIVAIESGSASTVGDARVIDARGRVLLPGLMDAHSHVNTLDGYRRALESGVTTIRTAGVGGFTDVAMAEMVAAGRLPGPDVLATGVYVTPEIGDAVLADPRLHGLTGDVRSFEDLELLVRVNAERGARWIKTRGTERAGVPTTDPREQVYSVEQLRVIVETAAEYGVQVMAHAHGDSGVRAAVEAGVASIEHGTYASEETLRLMLERGTVLVPTLSSISSFGQAGDYADPALFLRGQHMAPRRQETVARAIAMGIPIVTGVDTSYGPDSYARVSREVAFLVEQGLPPAEAIAAATSGAADLLGVADRTGRIAPGMEADLILVDRNPLEDIRSLQDILLVVSNGHVVVDRLGTIDRVPGPRP